MVRWPLVLALIASPAAAQMPRGLAEPVGHFYYTSLSPYPMDAVYSIFSTASMRLDGPSRHSMLMWTGFDVALNDWVAVALLASTSVHEGTSEFTVSGLISRRTPYDLVFHLALKQQTDLLWYEFQRNTEIPEYWAPTSLHVRTAYTHGGIVEGTATVSSSRIAPEPRAIILLGSGLLGLGALMRRARPG